MDRLCLLGIMYKSLLLFCFLTIPLALHAQKAIDPSKQIDTTGKRDLIDIGKSFFHIQNKIDTSKKHKLYFSILPLSSAVPGGGRAIFTATTAGFYLGERSTTYLSTVTFAPYFNFTGRYGFPFRSNLWLKNNSWAIQGDTRFLVYPQNTWGLGGGTPEFNKFVVNYNYARFYQAALKRITSYLYAGAGYNMDIYMDIETNNPGALQRFTKYSYGTSSEKTSFSSGVTASLLYDSRNNQFNPLPGAYTSIVYRINAHAFGSDADWQSIYIDMRKYISLTHTNQHNVLAFWTYYWKTFGNGIPYLNRQVSAGTLINGQDGV